MLLLFIMGVMLVLAAIILVAMAVPSSQPQGMNRSLAVLEAMATAPSELTEELNRPFADRVHGADAGSGPRGRQADHRGRRR